MPVAMVGQPSPSGPSPGSNNVDLEDGEIDDDDDDNAVLAVPAAAAPAPAPAPPPAAPPAAAAPPASGPSTPRMPPSQKNLDGGRREQNDPPSQSSWQQRRPPGQKANKKNKWGPPKSSFAQDDDEDDFAVQLEKVLQEKAREKAKQASKEKSGPDGEGYEDGNSGDEDQSDRKRKKRKKSRDEDEDKESKKKRREGDEEEDDMIFVRGASPNQHEHPMSPSYRDYDHDRSFDSYGEEEDDYDGSPDRGGLGGFQPRGRGRGGKQMRGAGRGRGRMNANDGGRGGFMNKRGNKRGNLRGGKNQRAGRDRSQDICVYFMQGKCPKDADECPFSHDATPRRKMELCKFYNMNCCAKREKCLYMHKDFPCKYFHTGRRCNSGDKCRFSHEPLTDNTRTVLLKHIELAPKEILGEFRRLTREQANQIIDRAAKLRSEGKNPEGMDLLRLQEEGDNNSGDERAHTPMPSSPGEAVLNESETRRNRNDENRRRDHNRDRDRDRGRDRDRERDRDRDRNRERNHGSDRKEHSDRREHREKKRKRRWDSPDNSPARLLRLQEELQRQLKEQDDEDTAFEKGNVAKKMVIDIDDDLDNLYISEENSKDKSVTSKSDEQLNNSDLHSKASRDSDSSPAKDATSRSEKHEGSGDSGDESQDSTGIIPTHLPKRQRELFLRIQQQQRRAEKNEESKVEESDEEAAAPEDDWYSSDEDGPTSLSDVLKNLKEGKEVNSTTQRQKEDDNAYKNHQRKEPLLHSNENDPHTEKAVQPARRPPLLPTPNILTDLMKNTAIDQLLSTIRYGPTGSVLPNASPSLLVAAPNPAENTSTPLGLQSPSSVPLAAAAAAAAAAPVRDPRLSRDPRSRSSSLAASTSPSASPSASGSAGGSVGAGDVRDARDPRREGRTDPRAERRDPRAEPRFDATMDALSSPRAGAEQRGEFRHTDPRAARADSRRTSDASSSSLGHNPVVHQKSMYDSVNPAISGAGDVDLRVRNVAPDLVCDTDFRKHSSHFGAGDMDMRKDLPSATNVFPTHDVDLRFRMGHSSRDNESEYAAVSQSDMDLRQMQLNLPFKPPPVHTPATEINASVLSYTPAPYHVVKIDIPKPDFSHLKTNSKDPQVKLDPRLRRLFSMGHPDPQPSATPVSPPPETSPLPNVPTSPITAPSDPRRRNSNTNVSRRVDPRQSRSTAPSMCPPTPRAEDFDELLVADTDLRMQAQFGRHQAPWENPGHRGRGLLPHPDPNWLPNAAPSFGRGSHMQPHPYHQQRSYTPPPH